MIRPCRAPRHSNGAGRPSEHLRFRRSQAPALLYRCNDSPTRGGCAILSNRKIVLVPIAIVCLAVRHSAIWAGGRLSRRGRWRTLASTPYVPELA
eukprot:3482692-Pyramimonas_sp.AAC.1